ncbi:hypothetical protein RhiJN_10652 [Ceratobasidium sp. AG-Ba]|nr:hypothetical protein RhiJN_10652 [Ceratobasidium sp. AG-Ba]QRW11392.1 hypothetical protein RhiLY_10391 [Ceratobasidium sp. AG-Ba]
MVTSPFALITTALAATTLVTANHNVSFKNNCGQKISPLIKNTANGVTYRGGALSTGGSSSSSVPENWPSGIILGLRSGDAAPDCPGCTRLECDFSTAGYKNCNLSRVSGYSIPMGFSWTSGSCKGAACKSPTCPPSDAWVPGVDDGSSLRFCNVANVGLQVTFCP